jgi:hypothetical protein
MKLKTHKYFWGAMYFLTRAVQIIFTIIPLLLAIEYNCPWIVLATPIGWKLGKVWLSVMRKPVLYYILYFIIADEE